MRESKVQSPKSKVAMAIALPFVICHSSFAFEGRIAATLDRGGEAQHLLYTVGPNYLRVEQLETDRPHARDVVNLQSGEITLLFPHNRSFVRLKAGADNPSTMPPGMPPMGMPSAVGPGSPSAASSSGSIGRTNLSGAPATPAMPQPPGGLPAGGMPAMPMMMPPMMTEKMELVRTNGTTNILGFACSHYQLKQRGEVMEIWATDKLLPFRAYIENQPHRFGPRMIEELWGGLVAEKRLFPLQAVLRFENGPERLRWEVTSVTPEKIKEEDEANLFQPPAEYYEIQPLPF